MSSLHHSPLWQLRKRLFTELDALVIVDPHTHIPPLKPAAETPADITGYHYYTELAHAAGLPREQIEAPGLEPAEKFRRVFTNLGPVTNTVQYEWLIDIVRQHFGYEGPIEPENWRDIFDAGQRRMAQTDWARQVIERSRLKAIFLTNDFDDPLEGFDTSLYIPCFRTDDLVFHLAKATVRDRIAKATGIEVTNSDTLRQAIAKLLAHFMSKGCRACAISTPPDFSPGPISKAAADRAIDELLRKAPKETAPEQRIAAHFAFWTLAELCAEQKPALPFDLMIGVNRGVYQHGVFQGMDLYDSRVSLIQYKTLFNAFPTVTFPISVLASVTNQELTSYAWIFPNVVTNGHWWYSNTPAFIEHDLAARLEAVPRTKQIGYYSDMYKLEFALPKFRMYKRILAKVLAERFVLDRGWGEDRALALGIQVFQGNSEQIFRFAVEIGV